MVCSGAQAPIFFNYMYAFVHVCVSASTHACACLPWRSRDHLQEVLVSFHHVVARIKLRLSGLACTLIGWAFLLALFKFIFNQKLFFFFFERKRNTLCSKLTRALYDLVKEAPIDSIPASCEEPWEHILGALAEFAGGRQMWGSSSSNQSCVCCTLTSLKVNVASRAGEIAQR